MPKKSYLNEENCVSLKYQSQRTNEQTFAAVNSTAWY